MDFREIKPFPNVAASSPISLSTDELRGSTLFAIGFEQGGTFTKAQLTNLRIKGGGKELLPEIDGDDLQTINDYQGITATSSYLFHFFGDPTARTIRGQWEGALDLSVWGDTPLEITGDIGAATNPTLQAHVALGAPKAQMGIGLDQVDAAKVRALIPTVVQPAAAVTRAAYAIGLGSEAGARIRALHFFHTNLTSVELRKQSEVLHEDLSIALNDAWQDQFGRVPQSGDYVVDRIIDSNQGEAESTLRNDGTAWPFKVLLTTSGSDTVNVWADVISAPPLL